ncbi:MAG: response regulator [Candidatus Eisenbacteria bacterium]|uniref:histidine kinase n=1 Tax=Eiseniibacteriota bacterium TaxID=2212470 RepID=A0A538SEB2_UNCEI|nr:MAG: response regulator [Candidatus Eisenbacteria bacterium]
MGDKKLQVLVVEDSEADGHLAIRELERAGYEVTHLRVDTEASLRAALEACRWDIVISDYNIPGFKGTEALALVRNTERELPFIFVSGSIGEETAVAAMRAGANDYVMKGNLNRLAPAIERELREAQARSERQSLEEQLRQAQKMEAVGRLAGGVAHDFNNILTAILGYSQMIQGQLGAEHELLREVGEVEKAALRAAALTRQLLAFSRRQVLQPKVLDLNVVVDGVESMLRRLIGADVELSLRCGEDLWRIKADAGQVEQVLMNLVVNARDAMPEGGKITIQTANVKLGEGREGIEPGSYVALAVMDTGTGMDEKTRAQIFEPFFTTKESGRGTGLGLSTVHGIVKQSGGHIAVESAPGQGSTFTVYLPRVEAQADLERPQQRQEPSASGSETVMVVEDDELVRNVVGDSLRVNGYKVVEVPDRTQALVVAETYGRSNLPVDLMLSDVVTPGMSPGELADRVRGIFPKIRILYMSGYNEHASAYDELIKSEGAFLQKPFTVTALLARVREVLSKKSPARK